MERVKQEIIRNSRHVKDEYETIQSLLTRILEKETEAMKEIAHTSEKNTTVSDKCLFDVLDFQCLLIPKLHEIDVELVKFLEKCPTILQGCTSNIDSTTSESNKKSSADASSSEEVSKKLDEGGKTIQEKLKSKKLLTRRDRFLQTVQRPDIPDLSFKPSTKVLENGNGFMTCPESSSEAEPAEVNKDKRQKKKRSIEKEVLISIPAPTTKTGFINPPEPSVNGAYTISYIASPSEFYMNPVNDDLATIDAMSHQLAEIYDNTPSPFPDKKSAMTSLGNECAAYIEDYKAWYRAAVTSWRLNARDYQENLVTVFLMDYGQTYNLSYEDLRELPEEFRYLASCAIKCHLAWLYPPGSTKDTLLETWSKESMDFFFNLIPDMDGLFKIVYVEKCGSSWGIDFISYDATENDVTFGQMMLDKTMAVEIFQEGVDTFRSSFFLDQIKTAQGLIGIKSDMSNEEKLDVFDGNAGDEEWNTIDDAMLGYKANDEARICKNVRPDGTCFKGNRCRFDHGQVRPGQLSNYVSHFLFCQFCRSPRDDEVTSALEPELLIYQVPSGVIHLQQSFAYPTSIDGITTDVQEVYTSAFKELEMPEIGSKVKLQVTNVVSINTFYASVITPNTTGLKYLIKAMNKRPLIQKYETFRIMPAVGELVIAQNWNKQWYRAMVRNMYNYNDSAYETYQVFFVDLGDVADLPLTSLRKMTADFLHLPFQAIQCRLYNVQPITDKDQATAKDYAESHFLCQIFDAEVMYASSSILQVVLRKEDNGADVGEQIIEDGFGTENFTHEYPSTSENLLVD